MLVKRLLPIVSSRKDSGGSEGVARRGDEVAIVVSNRKDSLTNAVRSGWIYLYSYFICVCICHTLVCQSIER